VFDRFALGFVKLWLHENVIPDLSESFTNPTWWWQKVTEWFVSVQWFCITALCHIRFF